MRTEPACMPLLTRVDSSSRVGRRYPDRRLGLYCLQRIQDGDARLFELLSPRGGSGVAMRGDEGVGVGDVKVRGGRRAAAVPQRRIRLASRPGRHGRAQPSLLPRPAVLSALLFDGGRSD